MTDHAAKAIESHQQALAAQAQMNRLAHERDKAIKAALDSGVSAVALAEQLGLTRQRIYTMARKDKE